MVQSPSWVANWFAASQEIPAFYGTRKFITAFTSARHLSLSWASSIQSIPHIPLPEDPSYEPALYRFLTFQVPNLMSLFRCLGRTKVSVQVQGFVCGYFIIKHILTVVSTSPNPQAGGLPLAGCPRLLIQYIRSYAPYRRPFLHPQPEDTPCRGDRDPLITWTFHINTTCNCL
jgi:hypothetical protein